MMDLRHFEGVLTEIRGLREVIGGTNLREAGPNEMISLLTQAAGLADTVGQGAGINDALQAARGGTFNVARFAIRDVLEHENPKPALQSLLEDALLPFSESMREAGHTITLEAPLDAPALEVPVVAAPAGTPQLVEQLISLLAAAPAMTAKELAEALGSDEATIQTILDDLFEQGRVRMEGGEVATYRFVANKKSGKKQKLIEQFGEVKVELTRNGSPIRGVVYNTNTGQLRGVEGLIPEEQGFLRVGIRDAFQRGQVDGTLEFPGVMFTDGEDIPPATFQYVLIAPEMQESSNEAIIPRLINIIESLNSRLMKAEKLLGITIQEVDPGLIDEVLRLLDESGGQRTAVEIAERLGADLSEVESVLQQLEDRDEVQKLGDKYQSIGLAMSAGMREADGDIAIGAIVEFQGERMRVTGEPSPGLFTLELVSDTSVVATAPANELKLILPARVREATTAVEWNAMTVVERKDALIEAGIDPTTATLISQNEWEELDDETKELLGGISEGIQEAIHGPLVALLKEKGPMTDEELIDALEAPAIEVEKAISDLLDDESIMRVDGKLQAA